MIGKISWRVVIILASAAMIAFFTYSYLNSLQDTATVYVYSQDIPVRGEITEDHIEEVEVQMQAAEALAGGNISSPAQVAGAIALREIDAGTIVRLDERDMVFPEERQMYLQASGGLDLSAFVPMDMRLVTVALPPEAVVDNSLKPNDWVDVIYTWNDPAETSMVHTETILQQIEVFKVERLSLDSDMGKEGISQHVTLLVTPQQAVELTHAKRNGNIDLTLNPWNGEQEETNRVNNNR
ncbi:Flp pilus assembly protein CpaB [Alteribacter natronophilus]|uniref:Flp pilus assembly protein CpaB n=1 Tax=Alteribacter natronophilus TaxID=2583810 RepID=UPI00110E8CC4|nr:Flp pilus assembly protein CpaB [Alteribacter natronophilus]TMW70682.1 Flp pilus assembly protein CpaB [Alteribacter natronophilus]